MAYLAGIGLTLAVEVPVVVLVARLFGARPGRTALVAVLASLVTHPPLWFVVAPAMYDWAGPWGVVLAELGVVLVEAYVYHRGLRPPVGAAVSFWTALLANALSFGIGIALW
jgi:hypothetical protein